LEGDAVLKADHSLMARVIDNFFVNALDSHNEAAWNYLVDNVVVL